jgi:Cys-rich protein (TIGR01571 family)
MPFETGLLACMDDKASCLDGLCCHCCQIGRQFRALDGQVDQLSVVHCILGLMFPNVCAPLLRCRVSDKFHLEEGVIVSLCAGCICINCSICQTHRQLTMRNCWPGGVCVKQPFTNTGIN